MAYSTRNSKKIPGLYGVVATSLVCGGILVGRLYLAGDGLFVFMFWNLFLAWVPFALSVTMLHVERLGKASRLLLPALVIAWILFLPNAPYMLTDLIHLKARPPVPYWLDIAMLGMFGVTGMFLGVHSLGHVHAMVQERTGKITGWLFATVVTLLSGLGIYLGRFLRWNTWDLATHPVALQLDLANRLLHPTSYPRTWGVTLVFGLSMLATYIAVRPEAARRE